MRVIGYIPTQLIARHITEMHTYTELSVTATSNHMFYFQQHQPLAPSWPSVAARAK